MFKLPEQIDDSPVIAPGVAGIVFTAITNEFAIDDPQLLLAITDTFPLVPFDVALIEFVVDVPVHPTGRDQVYEVAPLTATIE